MKLKKLPSDFVVEEVNTLQPKQTGAFRLYEMKKTGTEAFSAIQALSRENRVPESEIGFAGLKDTHAETTQYITVPAGRELKAVQGVKLRQLGFVDQPIKVGSLEGNRFTITVRDLSEEDAREAQKIAKHMVADGVPNYFDSQRFRSADSGEFIAKHVVRGDFESAVKLFLCGPYKHDTSDIKAIKARIREDWPNIADAHVIDYQMRHVIEAYSETKDWREAYEAIPQKSRFLYVSAYQSYLWNECIKELLWRSGGTVYEVQYVLGTLAFYDKPPKSLPASFKLVGPKARYTALEAKILERVLAREGLKMSQFDISSTGNFFKPYERAVVIRPEGFSISAPARDELGQQFKTVLRFQLPKGSYATVVIKRLFD